MPSISCHFLSLSLILIKMVFSSPNLISEQFLYQAKPKVHARASLMVQWIRVCLPMQGIQVQSPVQEDPTCHGATKPMSHNYWTCALEPVSHNYWAHVPQLLKPARLEPMLCNGRSHRNERPAHRSKEWPPLAATREGPRAATKTRHSQK